MAQYSLPYAVAATILLDPQDPNSFGEEAFLRPEMVCLMDKVFAHADADLERLLPERFPGGVTLTLKDGKRISRSRMDSVGTPDFPLNREAIVSKFISLTRTIASRDWQELFIDEVLSLDKRSDLDSLTALLRKIPATNIR